MTTIAQEIADLQAFHATVAGIETAPDPGRPVSVPGAHLPAILLRPGPARIEPQARGITRYVRTYRGVALCVLLNAGRGTEDGIVKVQTLMDALAAAYDARIEAGTELSTSGSVIRSYADDGEGETVMEYGTLSYEGFTFTVELERYA